MRDRGDTTHEEVLFNQPDIVLSGDADLIKKLQRKAEEYAGRVEYTPPEADPHGTYKRDILTALLERGTASERQLAAELSEQYGNSFSVTEFRDAYGVVAAYNNKEQEKLEDSTGLE